MTKLAERRTPKSTLSSDNYNYRNLKKCGKNDNKKAKKGKVE